MRDDLDDRLHDAVALDEIDLYADVLSAVAAAEAPLTDDEIDAVLGLGHSPDAVPGAAGSGMPAALANITSVPTLSEA